MNPFHDEPPADTQSTPHACAESEICRRAERYLEQEYLVVDYYRVRRKLAYPLPLDELPIPSVDIPGIPEYPWATWFSWALEERIFCLGHAAQWTGRAEYSRAAAHDLAMLAGWPNYRQYETPDLCLGHLSRILWTAHTRWNWLSPELRAQIKAACARIVSTSLPLHEAHFGSPLSRETILQQEVPHRLAHNIAFIGSIGIALAAQVAGRDEVLQRLNADIGVLVAWLLELRESGFSEAVGYDGHVLDFIADWLTILPESARVPLLSDARWSSFFEESLHLSAPGDVMEVAPLGDVEPSKTMHIGGQVKMHTLQSTLHPPEQEARAWYLRRLNIGRLRADVLAALYSVPEDAENAPPTTLCADAHYAVVLRSGWEELDVAVAVAASNSPMNHVAANYGSLCIGSEKAWFIQTPGYQQYLANSEREFTVGKASRNTPLVNDCDASLKAGRVLRLSENKSSSTAVFDLTACYTCAIELQSLVRSVHLVAHEEVTTVLVEDRIEPASWENVTYYWHSHPDAAWWVQDGFAMLCLNGRTLWISSPQAKIEFSDIQRLRGSRGQVTLVSRTAPASDSSLIQWLFVFDERKPANLQATIQQIKNQ